MAKLTLSTVSNLTGQETTATQTLNDNFDAIEVALENTLSLDGTSPNVLNTDLDLNDNDILNIGTINAETLILNGTVIRDSLLAQGEQGDAGTITVGTVTTLSPGASATVVNVGTTENAILDFGIPRGATGTSGSGTGDVVAANNLSDLASASTAFSNIKQTATESATGVAELATTIEAATLTDTSRIVTPAGVKSILDAMFMGKVFDYTGTTAPSLHVLAYGQAISRTTYSTYFALVGTTYGSGDGSTTFNVPDLRGRVVAGKDDMGGSSADRLTNQSGGLNGDTLGATGGSETHTLTEAQLAAHTHDITLTRYYGANSASNRKGWDTGDRSAGSGTNTSESAGGGQAHNNIQPTIILNKIIYVGA